MKILSGFVFVCLMAGGVGKYLQNVNCNSYVDYIPTDPGLYRYDPMYVNLHRCHGKYFEANPHNRKCLPKPENIAVFNITVFRRGGQPYTLKVENHTVCSQECIISQKNCTQYQNFIPAECDCQCNQTAKPVCVEPFQWDPIKCDCTCQRKPVPCGIRKEYSQEECGCTCKAKHFVRCAKRKQSINKDTCYCEEPLVYASKRSDCDGGVNGAMLAVIILGEAFVIVVCYYFFYIYCYKHNYLGRKMEKQNNTGYYHNGDIPCDTTRVVNGGTYHTANYDDDYNLNNELPISDKERIRHEETNGKNYPLQENNYPVRDLKPKYVYYPEEEEKSPLTKPPNDEFYMYNDIMEVDGPPSSTTDNHNLNIPPDYSDCDLTSEDGYASVTQV